MSASEGAHKQRIFFVVPTRLTFNPLYPNICSIIKTLTWVPFGVYCLYVKGY